MPIPMLTDEEKRAALAQVREFAAKAKEHAQEALDVATQILRETEKPNIVPFVSAAQLRSSAAHAHAASMQIDTLIAQITRTA